MNWSAVKRYNAIRSQRKAKRESYRAQQDARIERAGGFVKVDELRSATRRIEPPVPGFGHDREVWTFRGSDWVVCVNPDGETFAAYPFRRWRQDPDFREYVPMTVGANRWLRETYYKQEANP